MEILLNPMVLAIIIMITLCMLRMNVFLAMTVAALACALLGGATIVEGTSMFLAGMGGNAENALNILMFGVLAEAMSFTKAGEAFTSRMAKLVNGKVWILCALLFVLGILCETVILIYATFVPVVVPPLMGLLNKYKVDRRKVVTLIIAGLQIGYVCIPIGCGRMFQEIIVSSLADNGLNVEFSQVAPANIWVLVAMLVGSAIAFIIYRKPREYTGDKVVVLDDVEQTELPKIEWKHLAVLLSAVFCVAVQVITGSTGLGTVAGVLSLPVFGALKWSDYGKVAQKGMESMGFVGFVFLAATGFANVSRQVGDVEGLVKAYATIVGPNKFITALLLLILGLLVTMGIGSSWSTAPIVAIMMVPICMELGFSPAATILLVSAAACLGDAGSPASDQTLIPSATFNLDDNHDHIKDSCIPSFLCLNIPLLFIGAIGACII